MGVGPITAADFYAAVQKIWLPHVSSRGPFARAKIGLCVSGGPDSMALAYLCSRLRSEDIAPELNATAFVVDHQFRPESTDEAHKVSAWLENLGIKSEILTMDWTQEKSKSLSSAFETKARLKRYRLIAEACQRNAIHSIFLGHHADDNVETVQTRIVSYLGSFSGLQGIAPVTPIPCCDSLYGADPRGSPISLHNKNLSKKTQLPSWRMAPLKSVHSQQESSPNAPGILMFRPFLSYSKPQLLETCESNGVPFVSDPSNTDPTLTVRNTFRFLNTKHTLPRALQSQSILKLAARARAYDEDLTLKSESALDEAEILFDLRSGILNVRFPRSLSHRIDIMARALQRLVDVVVPFKSDQLRSRPALGRLCRVAASMFPELNKEPEKLPSPDSPPFHIDRVKIDRVRGPIDVSTHSTEDDKRNLSDTRWQISRMPLPRTDESETSHSFVPDLQGERYNGSKWLSWEGRYWIKLTSIRSDEVTDWHIRPLRVEDMQQIRGLFFMFYGRSALGVFNAIINMASPGKLRYDLPVITDSHDRIRFLPTLGVSVPFSEDRKEPGRRQQASYRIRYRPIEPSLLSKMNLQSFDTTLHQKLASYSDVKKRARSLVPSLRQARVTSS